MPLIDRLRLSKDLLTAGRAQLHAGADDATAIQGIVHVDLAFDIAARAALDHVGRAPQPRSARRPTDFGDVLAAFPELGAHATPISQVLKLETARSTAERRRRPELDSSCETTLPWALRSRSGSQVTITGPSARCLRFVRDICASFLKGHRAWLPCVPTTRQLSQ